VVVDRPTGSVSVIHFVRLLDEEERDKVKLDGRTVEVIDTEGARHTFSLDASSRLQNWEEALTLLGYVRRVNKETGVIDYHLATLENGENSGLPGRESDAVRLERSLRRPGYLKAQETYQKLLTSMGPSKDQAARERVDRIGQLIAAQSPLSGLKWNFDVIDTPEPNALCTGEGHVIVTSGLLSLNLSDDELAGVLGHEVAHGVRRHAEIYEERFMEYLKLRSELQQLYYLYQVAQEEQNSYKGQQLKTRLDEKKKRFDFVVDYLKNKKDYDQDEEEESDVLGMQYAAAAGYDPEGEARALIKLKNRAVQLFGRSYDDGSRTHPPLDRRLKILETVRRRCREERR
jgi:hypothetical protein